MRTAIVIPTFNERDSIKGLVHQIFALGIPKLEIIVVDDSSTDGTFELIRDCCRISFLLQFPEFGCGSVKNLERYSVYSCDFLPSPRSNSENFATKAYSATVPLRVLKKRFRVTIISRPRKMGLGSALKDGLSLALNRGARYIVTMDGDGSHDPARIPEMIALISPLGGGVPPPSGETDLVVGSRRIAGGEIVGWGPMRAFMSWSAMEFSRLALGIKTRDVTSGFRAYRRQVLEAIDLSHVASTGYAFQEEMLFRAQRAKFKIVEVPIIFEDRRHGKSKLGVRDIIEFFITVARLKISN